MHTYELHYVNGQTITVTGCTIGEACQKAGLTAPDFAGLTSYSLGGHRTEVAATAPCGCVHHAEDGIACDHDLRLHGLIVREDELADTDSGRTIG